MRSVQLRVHVPAGDPSAAYEKICDFACYSDLVDVVQSVTVRESADGQPVLSDWEVHFRNGLLRWSETDVFTPEQRRIVFEQTKGDFHVFRGEWHVDPSGVGCDVRFDAEFDFGIPSLAGILDPIAAKVLKETIALVIAGLLGDVVVIGDEGVAAAVAAKRGLTAVA
jgi:ribosome-associated toxin RatA of RatAB toxin-antitoxin module